MQINQELEGLAYPKKFVVDHHCMTLSPLPDGIADNMYEIAVSLQRETGNHKFVATGERHVIEVREFDSYQHLLESGFAYHALLTTLLEA